MIFRETDIGKVCGRWKVEELSSMINLQNGFAFKSKFFSNEGNPIIKIKNVNRRIVDLENCDVYPTKLCEGLDKFKVFNNDILIAMTGAGSVGRVSKFRVQNSKSYYINQRVGKIVPIGQKLDNEFLFQLLSTSKYEKILFDLANGSGQPNLSPLLIGKVKIPVPSIEEQKAIAKILSDLDDKIEVNNKINKRLEEMAQAIFKQWFVDFEFPNEKGKPYKSSGGEMVESELGMIPKGWQVTELNRIGNLTMGLSPKSTSYNTTGEGIPLLNGAADFNGGLIQATKFTTQVTRICKKGDLVFCIRATIGNITFADQEYCLGRGVAAIESKKETYVGLIYMNLFKSMEKLKSQATGSVILGLSKPDINNMKLILPIENVINEFSNIFKSCFSKKHMIEIENEKLSKLREALLPKLMSGEIRVPH